jgi:hypothetical protein
MGASLSVLTGLGPFLEAPRPSGLSRLDAVPTRARGPWAAVGDQLQVRQIFAIAGRSTMVATSPRLP